ncbi:MAG: pyridoxamine 5'-phosphate oxidase family protein [Candidatus Sericytochromatia bacterium]
MSTLLQTNSESKFKSRIERHPERRSDEQALAILAQGLMAHVGFVDEGLPYVIPMSYHFDPAEPEALYLHGSPHSRVLKLLAQGASACAEVTLLEGLVYSRAAMFHSMNYRSVLAFGHSEEVTDAEIKQKMFNAMIARYFEGRTPGQDYQEAPDKHLEQTLVVKLKIESISAKQREGGPNGPEDRKADAAGTAGVAPVPEGCPFHAAKEKKADV